MSKGADTVLWEYEDAGHLVLWAGNGCGTDRDEWARAVEFEHAQRLRLDEAWASAKAVNRDGVSVTTVSVQPAKGRLTRCVFRIPPGLGRDMVVSRLDGGDKRVEHFCHMVVFDTRHADLQQSCPRPRIQSGGFGVEHDILVQGECQRVEAAGVTVHVRGGSFRSSTAWHGSSTEAQSSRWIARHTAE